MHSQMSSGAPAPGLAPAGPKIAAPAPTLVPPKPKRSGNKWLVWLLALVVGGIAVERGVNYAKQSGSAAGGAKQMAAIRTVAITTGSVARTLRLTGTTG